MAKSTDEQVLSLLAKLQLKKKEIQEAERKPVWITTCTIGLTDNVNDRIHIGAITDPIKLIEIYSFLLLRESYWIKSATQLGFTVDTPPLHQNYKISDWKTDLRTRAGQLSLNNKKKELEALDRRVNALVSPEQRREMELKALVSELGD